MTVTKYEYARLIGARSLQLASGAPPLIKTKDAVSFIQIAVDEYNEDVLPLIVARKKEH